MEIMSPSVPLTLDEICKSMPKVELHAHLSGSISDEILMKLNQIESGDDIEKPIIETAMSAADDYFINNPNRSLAECWQVFGKIHELIKTPETLSWVTSQVIEDFSRDRVSYLELRTSPKKIHGIPSKDSYIESVIQAIIKTQNEFPIIVKLLVSIDRKMGASDQLENVELAIKWANEFPNVVVGMDVSGDPTKGSFNWILPLLKKARDHGLRISCHLPEVINIEETEEFLKFNPERVGHGLFLHPTLGGTEELWQMVKESGVPVEACITSNVTVGITPSLEEHYVKLLHAESMPYVICTDDSGVFKTSLSTEYRKLLQIVSLSAKELKELCLGSISYAFASDNEKAKLRSLMVKWWEENVPTVL